LLAAIFEIPVSDNIAAVTAIMSAPSVFKFVVSGFLMLSPWMIFSISDLILLLSKSPSRMESVAAFFETDSGFAEQDNKRQPVITENKKIQILPTINGFRLKSPIPVR
jgi:hypothetical protein